jgi:hypothetical protein
MIKIIQKYLNLTIIPNILCIILSFFLIIQTQKYTVLVSHDLIYPWRNLHLRMASQIYEYFFNNFLPNIFNMHPNDMRSNYGLSCIILSFLSVIICLLMTKAFFLESRTKNIFLEKNFFIIYAISFLFIFNPFPSIFGDYINFFRMEDLSIAAEYFFVLIPILLFLVTIYKITFSEYLPSKLAYCFYFIIFYILGSYNELTNIFSLLFIIVFILYLLIWDKTKLRNKFLWYIILPFFISFIIFYTLQNQFTIDLKMYNADIINILKQSLSNLKYGFYEFFNFMILNNIILYLFIFILLAVSNKIIERKNKKKNIIGFAISIILGYLLTNAITIFAFGLVPDAEYAFKRDYYNVLYFNILEFAILALLGIIYKESKYKKILIYFIISFILIFSFKYIISYRIIQEHKYITRNLVYKIEKINLIYTTLGETAIIPASFLNREDDNILRVLQMDPIFQYDPQNNMTNKYLTNDYYFKYFYGIYFETTYKQRLKGMIFKPDNEAIEELKKRLLLLNENFEIDSSIKNKNISFKNIYKKYKNKKITIKDIEKVKSEQGLYEVLIKAEAYIYYRDGDFAKSLDLYKKYLNNNPNDIDALIYSAIMYEKMNKPELSTNMYKQLQEIDNNNLLFKFLYLKNLFKLKEYKLALNICDDMINIEDKLATSYINKALILAKMNKPENDIQKEFHNAKQAKMVTFENFIRDNNINSTNELYIRDDIDIQPPTND